MSDLDALTDIILRGPDLAGEPAGEWGRTIARGYARRVLLAGWRPPTDADVVDAEIWCAGNCTKGPALHLASETCRVPEPEVGPNAGWRPPTDVPPAAERATPPACETATPAPPAGGTPHLDGAND